MQELDSRIDQLRHQLASLPELAEIAETQTVRARLGDDQRDAQILVDDLALEQQKADADVEQVKARRERDRSRMDAGVITNPKDLERMQHELVSLERRIGTLEDAEIEVMERLEEAESSLESLGRQIEAADARLIDLAKTRDEKSADLQGALETTSRDRSTAVQGLPEDLMTLYERIRAQKGVGAAPLRARQCGGCQLTLNAGDLARIKAAPVDEVVRCEECQRILVRTSESGL